MNLNKKVSPLGVIGIIAGVCIVVYLAWGVVVGRPDVSMPPYSQAKLAKLIVQSFSLEDDMQFYWTVFNAREISQLVDLTFDEPDDSKRSRSANARKELRDEWHRKATETENSYDDVLSRFDPDELESLQMDSYEILDENRDRKSGRIIGDGFVIRLHSDYYAYKLDIEHIVQTEDGWKIAGELSLHKEADVPEDGS